MSDDEWVSPRRVREDYVEPITSDIEDALKQVWSAVINGEVRARLNGIVLGPEWLMQIAPMKDPKFDYRLPPDLELSLEDAERKWPRD